MRSQRWIIILGSLSLAFFVAFLAVAYSDLQQNAESESRLNEIKKRGYVLCGVNGSLPYFSRILEDGSVTGFDADFCRVVATAVFGDYEDRVQFVPLSTTERFDALNNGDVDLLVRNTTWTVGRDLALNVRFGPVIFYDGQKIMVPNASGIETVEDLRDTRICVLPNTTSESNLLAFLSEKEIAFLPITQANGRFFQSTRDTVTAYTLLNDCDAISGDASQLVALQHSFIPDGVNNHHLLPEFPFSREPLTPVVRDGDEAWFQVVNYAVWATIYAEELNINQQNIDDYLTSTDIDIQEFLGISDDSSRYKFGELMGISDDFTYAIIKNVGNYGDIYNRNLADVIPVRGLNDIAANNGLLYSPPFRSVEKE